MLSRPAIPQMSKYPVPEYVSLSPRDFYSVLSDRRSLYARTMPDLQLPEEPKQDIAFHYLPNSIYHQQFLGCSLVPSILYHI